MTGVLGMRQGVHFDADELARLRWLVRCMRCGAVPTELRDEHGVVVSREVKDGNGGTTELPIVVTPHTEACAGVTKIGRPLKRDRRKTDRRHATQEAGPCLHCGKTLIASKGREKKYCDVTCRNRHAYAKRSGATS
jgi:hypothetical protein